jgi:hypothetical protein
LPDWHGRWRLTAAASPLMRRRPFGWYIGIACAMLLSAWFLTEISMRIWPVP